MVAYILMSFKRCLIGHSNCESMRMLVLFVFKSKKVFEKVPLSENNVAIWFHSLKSKTIRQVKYSYGPAFYALGTEGC